MGKVNTLLDVALEAGDGSLEELLLLVAEVTKDIGGLLGAVGLKEDELVDVFTWRMAQGILTPSSMGTEKKSTPVFSAISLPPGTPGR